MSSSSPQPPPKPQPYELSIIRSLQSRTASLTQAFLILDTNRDGYINRIDLGVALHNVFGIDLTEAQLDGLYARFCYFEEAGHVHDGAGGSKSNTSICTKGVRYQAFVDYITASTATGVLSSMHVQDGSTLDLLSQRINNKVDQTTLQRIVPTEQQRINKLRKQLGTSLRSRTVAPGTHPSSSSSSTGGTTASSYGHEPLTDATLFVKVDTHQTGTISLEEFATFVREYLGYNNWTDDDLRLVLGEHYHPDCGVKYNEFIQFVLELEGMDVVAIGDASVESSHKEDATDESTRKEDKQRADAVLSGTILRIADESRPDGEIIRLIAEALYSRYTRLVDAFRRMETDNVGRLSGEEFHKGLEEVGLGIGLDRLKRILSKFDGDGDGRLSLSEFVRLISVSREDIDIQAPLYPAVRKGLLACVLLGNEDALAKSKGSQSLHSLDDEDVAAIVGLREAFETERLTATKAFAKLDKEHSRDLSMEDLKSGFEAIGVSCRCNSALRLAFTCN